MIVPCSRLNFGPWGFHPAHHFLFKLIVKFSWVILVITPLVVVPSSILSKLAVLLTTSILL